MPRISLRSIRATETQAVISGRFRMNCCLRMAIVVAAALSTAPASAQQPANPNDAFLARAKAAAQFDFTGTLARLCVLPQTAPGPDVTPPPPARATWYTD